MYRPPRPANDDELALSQRLDALYTAWPFLGSRGLTVLLQAERWRINRKRVLSVPVVSSTKVLSENSPV